jgi:hypothetical protein
VFSDVLMEGVHTTRGGKSVCLPIRQLCEMTLMSGQYSTRPLEWENYNHEIFKTLATTASKTKTIRISQTALPKSRSNNNSAEFLDPARVKPSHTKTTKPKAIIRKPRSVQSIPKSFPPRSPATSTARMACISCAVRKKACDKKNPTCTACSQSSLMCVYRPLTPACAKNTTFPTRKTETLFGRESTFSAVVPVERLSLGTPQAKDNGNNVSGMDGSFGADDAEGIWQEDFDGDEDEDDDRVS